ncbi:MAG TPA: L-rhamnose mutarotase [Edaphobacter sp.]|nr:L-rhamnose mutarotase [Edaphobacter sp.]
MERIAFQLRIKAEKMEEYDEAHRHVWPELLKELESFGVSEYSIFRRGQQLFLYMHVVDYGQLTTHLAASEVNQRWQETMAPLFEPVPDLRPGESVAMMTEVFFMKGRSEREPL